MRFQLWSGPITKQQRFVRPKRQEVGSCNLPRAMVPLGRPDWYGVEMNVIGREAPLADSPKPSAWNARTPAALVEPAKRRLKPSQQHNANGGF
jgi:hypothetical protein